MNILTKNPKKQVALSVQQLLAICSVFFSFFNNYFSNFGLNSRTVPYVSTEVKRRGLVWALVTLGQCLERVYGHNSKTKLMSLTISVQSDGFGADCPP